MGEGGRHPFKGKKFASFQEGGKSYACVRNYIQICHITLRGKFQHHRLSIKVVPRITISKEGVFIMHGCHL